LDQLGKFKKSKHYYQLRHLSSLHDAGTFRLRMTARPVSFIFVLKGAEDYYMVWETYESEEATYIWKLDNREGQPQREELNELIERIKWLRQKNKLDYLRTHPKNFKRIEHDYGQSDGGVEKWKIELAEYIAYL